MYCSIRVFQFRHVSRSLAACSQPSFTATTLYAYAEEMVWHICALRTRIVNEDSIIPFKSTGQFGFKNIIWLDSFRPTISSPRCAISRDSGLRTF